MLKSETLTKPEDSIQDIRFTTVCLDLRGTAMPKDNEILDKLYDLFRGFMRQYLNLNPVGEVIHSHNKTELLIIPVLKTPVSRDTSWKGYTALTDFICW